MAKSTPVPVTDVPQNTREFLDQVLTDGRVLAVEVDDGRVAIVAPEWTGRTPRRRTTQGRAPRATPPECIEAALATEDKTLLIIAQRDESVDQPVEKDLFTIGTIGQATQDRCRTFFAQKFHRAVSKQEMSAAGMSAAEATLVAAVDHHFAARLRKRSRTGLAEALARGADHRFAALYAQIHFAFSSPTQLRAGQARFIKLL